LKNCKVFYLKEIYKDGTFAEIKFGDILHEGQGNFPTEKLEFFWIWLTSLLHSCAGK